MQHVEHHVLTYPAPSGEPTDRRAWIVTPPEHLPLVVVLEAHGEGGLPIQLAAETIALTVAEDFPGHMTVLHYDVDDDWSPRDWWMPLPLDGDGLPVFGGGLNDHPDVAATLRAAGLRQP